jgi:hypothetical protein
LDFLKIKNRYFIFYVIIDETNCEKEKLIMTKLINMQPFFHSISKGYLTPQIPTFCLSDGDINEIDLYIEKGWARKIRLKNSNYLIPETKRQESYSTTHITREGFEVYRNELKDAFIKSTLFNSTNKLTRIEYWNDFEINMQNYFNALDANGKYKIKKYVF